jgi:hypothetical protein
MHLCTKYDHIITNYGMVMIMKMVGLKVISIHSPFCEVIRIPCHTFAAHDGISLVHGSKVILHESSRVVAMAQL